ncbi:MAG: hypothetical protein K2K56_06495 [Lachnospiraceae bacterium]|nr:hypothetical protein [Lachnospiraceae bacterium]
MQWTVGDEVSGYNLPSIFENKEEEGYFDSGAKFYLNKEEWLNDEVLLQCIEFVSELYYKNCESSEELEKLNSSLKKIREKYRDT